MFTIEYNGTTYKHLVNKGDVVVISVERDEDVAINEVSFNDWEGLLHYVESLTGEDLSLTPAGLSKDYQEVNSHIPFMLIHGKLIQFTTTSFIHNGNGDDVFLVKDKEGNYHLLESSYEPDCDGAFYSVGYIDKLKGSLSDYSKSNGNLLNAMDLWGVLKVLGDF